VSASALLLGSSRKKKKRLRNLLLSV
jgi:hypothetical protein